MAPLNAITQPYTRTPCSPSQGQATQYRFMHTSHEDKRRSMHRHCSVYAWNELQPHTASNTNDNTFKVKAHSNTNMYALFVTRYEHVRAVRPGPTRHRSIRSIQSRQCHCSVFLDGKPWREITKSYSIERQYHLHIQAHSNTNVRRTNHAEPTHHRFVIHLKKINADPSLALHALYSNK